MLKYADNLPLVADPEDFAYIVNPVSGEFFDTVYSIETAESYIIDHGFIAIAANDWQRFPNSDPDFIVSKDELQMHFDRERAIYVDCWGDSIVEDL